MLTHPGTSERLLFETTSGSGVTSREISIQSDQALVSYWVGSITGSLTIDVYHKIDEGKEELVLSFGPITTPSTVLVSDVTGVVNARLRIQATYTGICSYEVYVRAVDSAAGSGTDTSDLLHSAANPTIANVSIPSASTEVSYTLPNNTKKFYIKLREADADMKLAFSAGTSGTTYVTVHRGTWYSEEALNVSSVILYFQATAGSQTAEIVSWV